MVFIPLPLLCQISTTKGAQDSNLLWKTQEKLKIFRTTMQETYRFLSVAFHFLEEASQLSKDIFQFVA